MTEQNSNSPPYNDVPTAVVRAKRHFSIVWLVPVVAVLIGAWLVYKAISEQGPTVTIAFKTAEGLEAGKTKIKYKDVEVGQVESISLSHDLSHVIVTAQLINQAKKFLSENTRFWVVRARVAAGGVSGLGTLFSGAYIGMDPGEKGASVREFKGLEIPPVVTTDLPGRHVLLQGDRLGSLDFGSPVFYRQIKVGQVVGYKLTEDGRSVDIKVFIHAPYHEHVRKNTRFWNASGLDASFDANGIKVNTESFVTLMIGGLAFDTPTNLEPGGHAEEGDVFKLYANKASIYEKKYTQKRHFLLHFSGSVRGLSVGAPVELRGIRIGEVIDIKLQLDRKDAAFRIPVLIEIEPDRVETIGKTTLDKKEFAEKLVERGLRAQLRSGSFLTGRLYVDLDFHRDAASAKVVYNGRYPELPTIPAPLEEITTSVTKLLEKLKKLPIEQIGENLKHTMEGADRFVNSDKLQEALVVLNGTLQQTQKLTSNLNSNVAPEVSASLEQTQKTLQTIESVIKRDSPLYYELKHALEELARAARSIRVMADYLERHPDALIYGKEKKK